MDSGLTFFLNTILLNRTSKNIIEMKRKEVNQSHRCLGPSALVSDSIVYGQSN